MDVPESALVATQEFNGGIIFVSFVISVIGAQTTLELLSRRTHLSGIHNWFLLGAAAFSMGGVAIWSMHFIGNNSLTLNHNGNNYHLNYSAGYTFASLVVAMACMFIAFAFVGVTEEAHIVRIIPSGALAGIGVAVMHYLGQFAIDFFHITYKIEFIAGAVIIACVAVIVALYIFFKLRENWTNQWYKRLGSAVLMGVAVCGMHYTAIAGTEFRVPSFNDIPPTPPLNTGALIGIISGIVILACVVLLYIAMKAGAAHLPIATQFKRQRLLLDVVFFDANGRILVDLDGIAPSKEILSDMEADSLDKEFTVSHPLFLRLFDVTTKWARRSSIADRPSGQSSTRTNNPHDIIESLFLDASRQLAHELRLPSLAELGTMFDDVIRTNTIAKPRTRFFNRRQQKKAKTEGSHSMLGEPNQAVPKNADSKSKQAKHSKHANRLSKNFRMDMNAAMTRVPSDFSLSTFDNATILEEGTLEVDQQKSKRPSSERIDRDHESPQNSRPASATTERLSQDAVAEDRHIFLVKRVDKKELVRLLALGYRFAESTFISRTMGNHLQIPTDHMSSHFVDMRLLAQSVSMLMHQQQPSAKQPTIMQNVQPAFSSGSSSPRTPSLTESTSGSSVSSESEPIPEGATRGAVYMGLSVLVQEDKSNNPENIHIIVDKIRRHAFPLVKLKYEDGETPTNLAPEERNCVLSLHGQSLQNMCSLESHIQLPRESGSTLMGRISTDWATSSDAASTLVGSGASPPDFNGMSPISSANMFSPVSPTSTRGATLTTRFTRALETASRQLVDISSYGKPLATIAKLNGEVFDIPPFGLTLGPCKLILFRAWVTIPGTISAINQTITEKVKCLPLPLYRSLAFHITDQAVARYRMLTMRSFPESTYLVQQRVYQSTASVVAPTSSTANPNPVRTTPSLNLAPRSSKLKNNSRPLTVSTSPSQNNTSDSTAPESPTTKSDTPENGKMTVLSPMPSLPPPPRTRKPKPQFPAAAGLSLLSLESLADKRAAAQQRAPAPPSASIELPTMLTILPTRDRFWWLDNMIDDIMHGD